MSLESVSREPWEPRPEVGTAESPGAHLAAQGPGPGAECWKHLEGWLAFSLFVFPARICEFTYVSHACARMCVCVRVYVCVCVLPLHWSMGNAWNCTQPFTVGSAVRGAHSKATQWDPGSSLRALVWRPITSQVEASVRSRGLLGSG